MAKDQKKEIYQPQVHISADRFHRRSATANHQQDD